MLLRSSLNFSDAQCLSLNLIKPPFLSICPFPAPTGPGNLTPAVAIVDVATSSDIMPLADTCNVLAQLTKI